MTSSKIIVAVMAIIFIAIAVIGSLGLFVPKSDPFRTTEFNLRSLDTAELATLTRKALAGDCISAYKVARHHLYFSLDDKQAIAFLRLASKCQNPDALAYLASLLTDEPGFDSEVDTILLRLKKMDSKTGNEAAMQVSLRRKTRDTRGRADKPTRARQ